MSRFTSNCPGCDGATAAVGDMLCPQCWKRVPRAIVDLYRLAYRLMQAQLVEGGAVKELARIVVREAREARHLPERASGPMAPTGVTVFEAQAMPSVNGHGAVGMRLIAALPTNPRDAIRASELARLAQHGPKATHVWLSLAIREERFRVRRRRQLSDADVPLGLWLYWRAA